MRLEGRGQSPGSFFYFFSLEVSLETSPIFSRAFRRMDRGLIGSSGAAMVPGSFFFA